MTLLDQEVASSAPRVDAGAPTRPSGTGPTVPLLAVQRGGCGCGGTCGSCGGAPDDERATESPALPIQRLASASVPSATIPISLRLRPGHLLQVQRAAGNRAARSLVAPHLHHLRVGATEEPAAIEGEGPTDLVAEADVMAAPPTDPPMAPPAQPPMAPPSGTGPPPATAGPAVQRNDGDDGSGILGALTGRAEAVAARVRDRGQQVAAALGTVVGSLVERVRGVASAVADRLGRALAAVAEMGESLWNSLRERVDAMQGRLSAAFDALRARVRGLWEQVKVRATTMLQTLRTRANALVERVKGRVVSMLGATTAPGGSCVTAQALDRAHAVLPGDVDAAVGELDADGASEAAAVDAEGEAAQAEGEDGEQAVATEGRADVDAAESEVAGAKAQLEAKRGEVAADAEQGVAEVGADADAARTEAQTTADHDAEDLGRDGRSSVDGLSGLVGGVVAAILNQARTVIDRVRAGVDRVVTALVQQAAGVLQQLGERVQKIVSGIKQLVEGMLDRLIALLLQLMSRLDGLLQTLRAVWDRIAGLLSRLAEAARALWTRLRALAVSAWNRLKSLVGNLRARAAALFPRSDCDVCDFKAAVSGAEELATGTDFSAVDLGSLADLVVSLKRQREGAGTALPPQQVAARLGPGQPLEGGVRRRMEGAFGQSFDHVLVHTDEPADQLAGEMGARAFTLGAHVGFGAAEYRPGTLVGDALLAHELAHVAQQTGTTAAGPQSKSREETDDRAQDEHDDAQRRGPQLEDEADDAAVAVVERLWAGGETDRGRVMAIARSGLAVRRCSKCCDIKPPSGDLKLVETAYDCGSPLLQTFNEAIESKKQNRTVEEKKENVEVDHVLGLTGFGSSNEVNGFINQTPAKGRKCPDLCEVDLSRPPEFRLSPYFAVKPGPNDRPEGAFFGKKTKQKVPFACRGKQMKKTYRITPDVAALAKRAEIEHCEDLKLGWNHTIAKYVAAVMDLASGFCKPEGIKCEDELTRLARERSNIQNPMRALGCYQGRSADRDSMGWHTFKAPQLVEVADDCTEAIYEFNTVGPKIDEVSPSDQVKSCGPT